MKKQQKKRLERRPVERTYPYCSAPVHPATCVFFLRRVGKDGLTICNFGEMWGAKLFLDQLLLDEPNDDYDWVDDNKFRTESGLEIKFDPPGQFQELLGYKLTEDQASFELDEQYIRAAHRFRTGKQPERRRTVITPEPSTPKPAKKVRTAKPRVSKDGLVTISDIASELNVSPREARGILRKKKVDKPDAGWAWSSKDAEKIKDIVKKG